MREPLLSCLPVCSSRGPHRHPPSKSRPPHPQTSVCWPIPLNSITTKQESGWDTITRDFRLTSLSLEEEGPAEEAVAEEAVAEEAVEVEAAECLWTCFPLEEEAEAAEMRWGILLVVGCGEG